ncbi:hypothetical protein V2J09_016139 [Rumex salicifolius]
MNPKFLIETILRPLVPSLLSSSFEASAWCSICVIVLPPKGTNSMQSISFAVYKRQPNRTEPNLEGAWDEDDASPSWCLVANEEECKSYNHRHEEASEVKSLPHLRANQLPTSHIYIRKSSKKNNKN